jgi:sugar/nucleoside kinase (ribokinase family)
MKTTVIVGDLNVDVVLPAIERMPRPGEELFLDRSILKAGGSAANTAIVLARAGCPVRLCARVGTDGGAAFLVEDLRSCGVDTSTIRIDPVAFTGITVSLPFPGTAERAYLTYPGSLAETGIEDLKIEDLKIEDLAIGRFGGAAGEMSAGHLHCTSFFIQERLQAGTGPLLKQAKRAGVTTSLDPGRLVVRLHGEDGPAGRVRPWDISALSPYFEFLDWFMPNAGELGGITGIADPWRALESFGPELKGVVVKLGAAGALTRHEGKIKSHPTPAAYPLDTTCAGDCFDAGFLYGISRGLALEESADLGNRFGALAVSCLGLPERAKIQSLLEDLGYGKRF